MAKILQFPSRELLQKEEQIEMLNRHLDLCEEDIKIAMLQLDELNEALTELNAEYSAILSKLQKLVLDE
jgi:nitrate reductase assembly molybdenum cofactor insertion protein NarJ